MKPCIFLDIDGVINPNRKSTTYHFDYSLPNTLAKKLNHPKIANLNVYLVNQVYSCFSKESIDYLKQLIVPHQLKKPYVQRKLFEALENWE